MLVKSIKKGGGRRIARHDFEGPVMARGLHDHQISISDRSVSLPAKWWKNMTVAVDASDRTYHITIPREEMDKMCEFWMINRGNKPGEK